MEDIKTYLQQQGNNRTLLAIFPHPDDETAMSGGLIQVALKEGWEVIVISVTAGERGRIHVHGNGNSLRQIRKGEYQSVMQRLGVTTSEVWSFPDGRLKERSVRAQLKQSIVQSIQIYKPSIIVTYGPDGITGHPDHVALSKTVYELLPELSSDLSVFWVVEQQSASHALPIALTQKITKLIGLMTYQSQGLVKDRWLMKRILSETYEYYQTVNVTTRCRFKYFPYEID